MATKTVVEIGEGDRVIRRTECPGRPRPLVGVVEAVLDNGKLRVRWEGTYPRVRGGWQTIHSTVSAGSLRLATEENIATSQRQIYTRLESNLVERIAEWERRADDLDARGKDGWRERQAANTPRERLQELRRRMANEAK